MCISVDFSVFVLSFDLEDYQQRLVYISVGPSFNWGIIGTDYSVLNSDVPSLY